MNGVKTNAKKSVVAISLALCITTAGIGLVCRFGDYSAENAIMSKLGADTYPDFTRALPERSSEAGNNEQTAQDATPTTIPDVAKQPPPFATDAVTRTVATFFTDYIHATSTPQVVGQNEAAAENKAAGIVEFLYGREGKDVRLSYAEKIDRLIARLLQNPEVRHVPYDPILMSRDTPQQMQYSPPREQGESAEIIAYALWSDGRRLPICVSLSSHNSAWQIEDIQDIGSPESLKQECAGIEITTTQQTGPLRETPSSPQSRSPENDRQMPQPVKQTAPEQSAVPTGQTAPEQSAPPTRQPSSDQNATPATPAQQTAPGQSAPLSPPSSPGQTRQTAPQEQAAPQQQTAPARPAPRQPAATPVQSPTSTRQPAATQRTAPGQNTLPAQPPASSRTPASQPRTAPVPPPTSPARPAISTRQAPSSPQPGQAQQVRSTLQAPATPAPSRRPPASQAAPTNQNISAPSQTGQEPRRPARQDVQQPRAQEPPRAVRPPRAPAGSSGQNN